MTAFAPIGHRTDYLGANIATAAAHRLGKRAIVIAIVALAIGLRLAGGPGAGIYHPDELFQYFEQSHRLLFGQGVVPWEYRYGMRSWLMPLSIAPPMLAGAWLAPGTSLYLLLPRVVAATLSLTVVWTAWHFGRRISQRHAVVAVTIAAIWPELVYFAPHVLSETFSIALFLPAAVLLIEKERPRHIAIAGLLLGLACLLRLQHVIAAGALATMTLWRHPQRWVPLLAGTAAALLVGATVDAAMGQVPFGWAVEYVRQNLFAHRADAFGTAPPWAYAQWIGQSFGWWTAPILALAALGARRYPTLFRVGVVNLAVHMAIGHKEYRFVLLTTMILLLLAAIGTGDVVEAGRRRGRSLALWIALGLWATASATLAASGRPGRYAALDAGQLSLFADLRRDPDLCGLATHGFHFSGGGGYAYLHRLVPLFSYAPDQDALMRAETRGFNRLLAPSFVAPPAGFARRQCGPPSADYPALCLFVRPGDCTAIESEAEINRLLARIDQ